MIINWYFNFVVPNCHDGELYATIASSWKRNQLLMLNQNSISHIYQSLAREFHEHINSNFLDVGKPILFHVLPVQRAQEI